MLYAVVSLSLLLALTCVIAYPRSLRPVNTVKRCYSRLKGSVAYSGNDNDFGNVVMVEGPVLKVKDPNTNTRVTLVGVSHGSPASAGE